MVEGSDTLKLKIPEESPSESGAKPKLGLESERIQQLEAMFQKLADQEQGYADRGEPEKSPLQIIAKAGFQLMRVQTPEEKAGAMEPVRNLFGILTPDEAEAIIYKKQGLFKQYGINLRDYLPSA